MTDRRYSPSSPLFRPVGIFHDALALFPDFRLCFNARILLRPLVLSMVTYLTLHYPRRWEWTRMLWLSSASECCYSTTTIDPSKVVESWSPTLLDAFPETIRPQRKIHRTKDDVALWRYWGPEKDFLEFQDQGCPCHHI